MANLDGIRGRENPPQSPKNAPKLNKKRRLMPVLTVIFVGLLLFGAAGGYIWWNLHGKTLNNQKNENVSTTKLNETTTKPDFQTGYVTVAEGLRLRRDADPNSAILATMPYGATVTASEQKGDWVRVKYAGSEGWCLRSFISAEKPKELNIRDVDFTKIISVDPAVGSILTPEYADFNKDGREEALVKVLYDGSGFIQEFYVYGYKDGAILTKYLEVTKKVLPAAYVDGSQGHEKMSFTADKLTLSYPIYKKDDPNCCPTGGSENVYFKWNGTSFIIDTKEAKS